MSRPTRHRPTHRAPRDAGLTMAEVLVATSLFSLLGTVLLGFVISTAAVSDDVRAAADVSGEARLALERMSRELRQARDVEAATLSSAVVSVTFWTDFNGNGIRDVNAVDPEVLTYRWERDNRRLTLTANDPTGQAITRPVLAGNVESMELGLRSSLWQYDGAGTGTRDGVTTWQELDTSGAPVGNVNGLPDPIELDHVDLVSVVLRVSDGGVVRDFVMQADLRNQDQQ